MLLRGGLTSPPCAPPGTARYWTLVLRPWSYDQRPMAARTRTGVGWGAERTASQLPGPERGTHVEPLESHRRPRNHEPHSRSAPSPPPPPTPREAARRSAPAPARVVGVELQGRQRRRRDRDRVRSRSATASARSGRSRSTTTASACSPAPAPRQAPSGSFTVARRIPNRAGTDNVVAAAKNAKTGESCVARCVDLTPPAPAVQERPRAFGHPRSCTRARVPSSHDAQARCRGR